MVADKHHIEMEDISGFAIERSADYSFWEDISHDALNEEVLKNLPEATLKTFLGVVRSGSAIKLHDYFYRIRF